MKPSHLSRNRQSARRGRERCRRRALRVHAEAMEEKSSSRSGCFFLMLILVVGTGLYVWKQRERWNLDQLFTPAKVHTKHTPDPVSYDHLKKHLANDRKKLEYQFIHASTAAEQEQVLDQASELLEHTLPKMMRCWLGHPWDFHGMATVPGEGKIACGYYVSVIMRDAGFKVNRVKLAQRPSQSIIRTFLPSRRDFWICGGMSYHEYVGKIKQGFEGINIVGLDKHVGFVVIENDEMRFIHSGGLQKLVVDEAKPDAHSLKVSNYRVIGNISRNRELLRKWVLGDTLKTAY